MHLLDGFTLVIDKFDQEKKCEYKPTEHKWKANLDGNSTTLANKLGNKPHANSAQELSSTSWPSQAHHLIPHKTLKSHPVAALVKKGKTLYEDANYDVDHKKNGIWLPYASSLPEWSTLDARGKRRLMFEVMALSGLQLHQGPHSSSKYGMGEAGYKQRVKQYLGKIQNNAISHYAGLSPCQDCKSKSQNGKYPARDEPKRYLDMASYCLKKDILNCKIFVSKIASEFAQVGGF